MTTAAAVHTLIVHYKREITVSKKIMSSVPHKAKLHRTDTKMVKKMRVYMKKKLLQNTEHSNTLQLGNCQFHLKKDRDSINNAKIVLTGSKHGENYRQERTCMNYLVGMCHRVH